MSSTIRSTVTIAPRRAAERAPHPFEQRRVQRDVAGPVGDRRVQQRDVGLQRREQPDLTERRVDARERVVRFHRRARDRARHDRGQAARRRLRAAARTRGTTSARPSTSPRSYAPANTGFGVKFGNVSPE